MLLRDAEIERLLKVTFLKSIRMDRFMAVSIRVLL